MTDVSGAANALEAVTATGTGDAAPTPPAIEIRVVDDRAYVYDAQACVYLRSQHRLVGVMVGSLPGYRSQDVARGLPLELSPEEATLCIERGWATMAFERDCESDAFKAHRADVMANAAPSTSEMVKVGQKRPAAKLDSRGWGGGGGGGGKKTKPKENLHGWQKIVGSSFVNIPLANATDGDGKGSWSFPSNTKERERYAVFKDLHDRQYSLTSGAKFGSDYLVYPGDPILYHAHYTVRIVSWEATLHPLVIAATTRMAHAARKNFVIAAVREVKDDDAKDDDSVAYEVRYFTMEADVDLSSNRGF
jgi:tRNA-splicing endonuclease subunit Sen34